MSGISKNAARILKAHEIASAGWEGLGQHFSEMAECVRTEMGKAGKKDSQLADKLDVAADHCFDTAQVHKSEMEECEKAAKAELVKTEAEQFAAILDRSSDLQPTAVRGVASTPPTLTKVFRPGQEAIYDSGAPNVPAEFADLARIEDQR